LAASLGVDKAQDYLSTLQEMDIAPLRDLFLSSDQLPQSSQAKTCAQQLQFIASDLSSVVQARQFKAQFEQDPRFENLSICINPVAWLAKSALDCEQRAASGLIKCDLSAFSKIKKRPSFTHLVVFTESGKAYVQRGVMYLDRSDEYSVFIHELAHFAAFVDEYPLSQQMARIHCILPSAPNLLVNEDDAPLSHTAMQRWHAADTDLQVSVSRTCNRQEGVTSFKPSADITFLEHHDTEKIPPIYLELWQQQLEKQDEAIGAAYEFLHLAEQAQWPESIAHWQNMLSE